MTRRQASRQLRRLGWSKLAAGRILDAAQAQREVMTSGRVVRVEYKDGSYTITR